MTPYWEHDYSYNALSITVSSADFPVTTDTSSGPSEGHNSAIVNAVLGVQWSPGVSAYVGYEGQLGRDRYNANAVTGDVSLSF